MTNADGRDYGTLSLRSATEESVNTVYAQLIQQLGADTVIRTAESMGMRCCTNVGEPRKPLLAVDSAVLGSNEANTLEMASAYGTLATGGRRVAPVPVESVVATRRRRSCGRRTRSPQQVVDPQVAAAANDILQDVVLYGTGTAANIGRPQIGKTGTDDNHDNAWFVGAVPQLSAAVWVGFHEGQIPMEPPRTRITVFGGTWPAQIWRVLMQRATASLPKEAFPTPEVRYVTVSIDSTQDPACLPNEFTPPNHIESLNFVAGTEPTDVCTTPTSLQQVLVPSVIGFDEARASSALTAAGFYVKSRRPSVDRAAGNRDLSGPRGRDLETADQHRDAHGRRAARGRLDARVGVAHGEPPSTHRHGVSRADGDADAAAGGDPFRGHRLAGAPATARRSAPGRCHRTCGRHRALARVERAPGTAAVDRPGPCSRPSRSHPRAVRPHAAAPPPRVPAGP